MSLRRHAATVAIFACLAILHTWPVARIPGTWTRTNGDYGLNAWVLAWVVHQAPRDPLHLFDANIFHPEPRTLAFSEHLVPQAVLAAPVLWADGSAVLAYNVVMMLGFALSGWAMAWAVTRWTGHWGAGLVAGALHAFNAHTMTRLVHVQALHVYYLPMALVALDVVFERKRWRDGMAAGTAAALQALTSGYWLVFTIAAMAAGALARVGEWGAPPPGGGSARWRRPIVILGLAALGAGLLLAPFLYPYWQARQEQGLVRGIQDVTRYSATWVDYLTTTGRLHQATPLRAAYFVRPAHDVLFPGVTATLLALVAVACGAAWRDRRARMLCAIGVAGVVLSLGPALAPYRWLYDHVPLVQGIRAPSRFGILTLVAVAGLAGFGFAWIDRRVAASGAGGRRALLPLALALVTAEAFRPPLDYPRPRTSSPVYQVVAQLPEPMVVAEFPMYRPSDFYRNADYMLDSTTHWKRLVNGYSGFQPQSYRRMAEAMRTFPDPPTTDVLRDAGVTHVIIHRDRLGAGRDLLLAAMLRSGEFEPVAADEQVRLFRLRPRGPRP